VPLEKKKNNQKKNKKQKQTNKKPPSHLIFSTGFSKCHHMTKDSICTKIDFYSRQDF
jgi:hypothetical protein